MNTFGKIYFMISLKQPKIDSRVPFSQRQAIIKLIAKKDGKKKEFSKTGDQFCYLMLTQKYFLNHFQKN